MSDIRIRAIPQMDDQVCHFELESPIATKGVFRFSNKEQAQDSALAKEIFATNHISSILVIGSTIILTKSGAEAWNVIGKDIGQSIRKAITSKQDLIAKSIQEKTKQEKELAQKVQKIILEQINPSIASHGGFIEIIDVVENDLVIKMGGGCQGCSSSKATLKDGISQTLKQELPELGQIIDGTDHTAGVNPYY